MLTTSKAEFEEPASLSESVWLVVVAVAATAAGVADGGAELGGVREFQSRPSSKAAAAIPR